MALSVLSLGLGALGPGRPRLDGAALAVYSPMLAWGPLLLAVAVDYRRRRAAAPGTPKPG